MLIATPDPAGRARLSALEAIWTPIRWLVVLAMTAGAFAVLYRFAPSRARARWRWVVDGRGAGRGRMAGRLAGLLGLLTPIAHYDATYGPLGAVIAFMVWVWFSIMAILVGAELNAEIEHQTASTPPPAPNGRWARAARPWPTRWAWPSIPGR
jgi:membrane protein